MSRKNRHRPTEQRLAVIAARRPVFALEEHHSEGSTRFTFRDGTGLASPVLNRPSTVDAWLDGYETALWKLSRG